MRCFLFFSSFLVVISAYKFLAYNPQFGNSHVNFISRLSDALIDAGHEVVMVSPRTDTLVGTPKTKARLFEVRQAPEAAQSQARMNAASGELASVWQSSSSLGIIHAIRPMLAARVGQCAVTLDEKELFETLGEEHFDAAFTENFDFCGYALIHKLGITKYATTVSMANQDGQFHASQVPAVTSYIPTMLGGSAGDRMSFFERLHNTFAYLMVHHIFEYCIDLYQSVVDSALSNPPNMRDLVRNASLVFMNSDPLADFPKLTSPRVIDIGGITLHAGHKPLDKKWSDILDLRNQTVFISFGTFVKSHLMPSAYKETIRETIKKFPSVTFVWKYEKPEDNISAGIDNLVETTWAPQHDLLNDKRLTAFITHGGQGSISESAQAGIPLVCIPVVTDQYRNARQVERNGVGIMLKKEELAELGQLETAIARVLENKSFKANAALLSEMIAERPFSMKEVFVRNMEFMAKYGPLRRLDHYGAQLSFVQYYLIDIVAFLALIGLATLALTVYLIMCIYRSCLTSKKVKSQ